MAEALLLSVVGMLASPFINKLVTDSMHYLGRDVNKDVAKDLEDLETNILPQLKLTMLATKGQSPDKISQLTKWLAKLKDACIKAARILNKVKRNRRQPALLSWWVNGKKKKLLIKQLKYLKEVAAEAKTFYVLLDPPTNSRPITSGNRTDPAFGRDGDRDKIIEFLLDEQRDSNSNYNYSVVCVVTNMRGAGKTTLAQYVYNDSRVENHFTLRMWLCLSENLNITKVTKEMIECVTDNRPKISNLGCLQDMLKAQLPTSGKIMVILDDVFFEGNADEQPWGSLFAPFASRERTCKIVVTSRAHLLPRSLRGEFIEWSDLTPPHFQSFLRYHTIKDLHINNPQLVKELSHIVNEIAEKMSEMKIQPLEAEFVGNRLYNQPDKPFWQATLKEVEEFFRAGTYRLSIS